MKKVIQILSGGAEDILIFAGLACIAAATFLLSYIAGLYVTGAEMLGLGIWFTAYPPGKG